MVVIGALFGVVQGQQTAFYQGNLQRAAQGQARAAYAYVAEKLANAGYGMDPSLAFDFTSAVAPCPLAACPRDATNENDELVFFSRNDRYWCPSVYTDEPVGNAWRILSVAGDTARVNARTGDVFPRGRILQAVCGGADQYAYFTVAQTVKVTSAGAFDIPLVGVVTSNPFLRQDQAYAACFQTGQARLFLIDRYRFHVRPETVDGNVVPYLVLDQGVDRNLDGAIDEDDELLVAEGVENLQVGYVLANAALPTPIPGLAAPIKFVAAPAGDVRQVPAAAGSTAAPDQITIAGFPGAAPAFGESPYLPSSFLGLAVGPPPAAQRLTDHQANVIGLRLALVTRSAATDRSSVGDTFRPLNMTADPSWVKARQVGGRDGYQRALFTSTVLVPNMTAGGLTYF
jgi:type IV pilus assembly protein PilW